VFTKCEMFVVHCVLYRPSYETCLNINGTRKRKVYFTISDRTLAPVLTVLQLFTESHGVYEIRSCGGEHGTIWRMKVFFNSLLAIRITLDFIS
jgi:hypothetical protein